MSTRLPPRCHCGSPMRTYQQHTCNHCGTIALHDIHNAQAFIQNTIHKHLPPLHKDERDDLQNQALEILIRMAHNYQPGLGGRNAQNSRFAGYAAQFLPGKLTDALHRMRGHKAKTQPDGTRTWETTQPISLQRLIQDGPHALDRIPALTTTDTNPETLDTITQLPRLQLLHQYLEHRADGHDPQSAGEQLRLTSLERRELERIAAWLVTPGATQSVAA